jgi:hypothetical protein
MSGPAEAIIGQKNKKGTRKVQRAKPASYAGPALVDKEVSEEAG